MAAQPTPSPEAMEAAYALWSRCAGMWHLSPKKIAKELDRFAVARVEAERERCAAACNPLTYGMAGEEIRSRIVRGWQP